MKSLCNCTKAHFSLYKYRRTVWVCINWPFFHSVDLVSLRRVRMLQLSGLRSSEGHFFQNQAIIQFFTTKVTKPKSWFQVRCNDRVWTLLHYAIFFKISASFLWTLSISSYRFKNRILGMLLWRTTFFQWSYAYRFVSVASVKKCQIKHISSQVQIY